jgi:hypothetical protein
MVVTGYRVPIPTPKGIAMAFSAWMGFLILAACSRINGNCMK